MKKYTLFLIVILFFGFVGAQEQLPQWEKGYLDIHHINTGRGSCAFLIFPDGTNMMVDAGDFDDEAFDTNYAPMFAPQVFPNSSYTAGTSIVNYLTNILGRNNLVIDYFLLTHFHSDHYGSVNEMTPFSEHGYRLTGLTEVGDIIPIKTYVDRDYPDYNFPVDLRTNKTGNGGVEFLTFQNLMKFLDYQKKHHGMKLEKFDVGSNKQFVLKKDAKSYPTFEIRNIKSNNLLWTGKKKETKTLYSVEQLLKKNGKFNDNQMSTAFVVTYGKFKYYAGGDNSGLVDQDHEEWYDIETPMAPIVGEVSAMTLNHHSNRDATNQNFLNTLNPKVVIAQSWSPDHPGPEVAMRLLSSNIGSRERDIFMNYYHNETGIGIGPWYARRVKSKEGHILIRVYPDGKYNVFILDSRKANLTVKNVFGPYSAD